VSKVPRFQIYSSSSGSRLPYNALAIKIVSRVHNMILDNSSVQPGAFYLALAYTQHPHPKAAGRLTINVLIVRSRGLFLRGQQGIVD
jgi:hypothetical protein